jgi:hypothetical protein
VGIVLSLLVGVAVARPAAAPVALYVDPAGTDTATGGESDPLRTIQAALDRAQAGTTIHLAAGVYHEEPHTVRDGTPDARIAVEGPTSGTAILYGEHRIFNIDHSWITLRGFTIDGEEALAGTAYPTEVTEAETFKDSIQSKVVDSKLVFVGSAPEARDVTGVTIDRMTLVHAGNECVHLRDGTRRALIERSTIEWCGLQAQDRGSRVYRYHNGEGVYIGTSPQAAGQPMTNDDDSSHNTVLGNRIATYGSECFDVKEHAHDNRLQGNLCLDNTEPGASGGSSIELRGFANAVVGNSIAGSLGYELKIASDGAQYDHSRNTVRRNAFSQPRARTLRVSGDQGLFCGNLWGVPLAADGSAGVKAAPVKKGRRRPRC